MTELDLHGVRHHEVESMVENFILMNQSQFPLTIICGNSSRMIELVNNVVKRLDCDTHSYSYGRITVRKFK
jgi:hypothetical protein